MPEVYRLGEDGPPGGPISFVPIASIPTGFDPHRLGRRAAGFRGILGPMRLELTKRGDYAVRAMIALARGDGARLSARRIADAMQIPVRFLPQVLADLQRAGLVIAAAGRSGGYLLARDAGAISLLEVIEAVEGESRRRTCVLRGGPCSVDGTCDVHDVFFAGQEALLATLATASLGALARRERPLAEEAPVR